MVVPLNPNRGLTTSLTQTYSSYSMAACEKNEVHPHNPETESMLNGPWGWMINYSYQSQSLTTRSLSESSLTTKIHMGMLD